MTAERTEGALREPADRQPLLEMHDVSREYRDGPQTVTALDNVSLRVNRGSLVAVHGRSGSGKTTLLNIMGALDRPTAGRVRLDGHELTDIDEAATVAIRRTTVAFVFQAFGLIPILTAEENVGIPLRLTKTPVPERERRAREVLELVGLADRRHHRPHELSGGEQQRVAIARALANHPQLLLADEPTGQLDSRTGRAVMQLIHDIVRTRSLTAVVATHDPALIDLADRVIELRDGRIVDQRGP
ncbi:MAG: ABC transporter ATP-binding protein [Acidimicrobiia bacterium]|nr:ABC transporter ATP-binding protein [Acidimicrobiia bacterium]MBT8216953.1 ABC transporter ATP-binding protein [Acidimicrobiia bacterium]NNF11421.1 ABC transporter ATP-binding protein [Acidimicrobiia bacterium]NNL69146.1 ABC transporter ATP-binding protein [Acidimicrobiia bacterium]